MKTMARRFLTAFGWYATWVYAFAQLWAWLTPWPAFPSPLAMALGFATWLPLDRWLTDQPTADCPRCTTEETT